MQRRIFLLGTVAALALQLPARAAAFVWPDATNTGYKNAPGFTSLTPGPSSLTAGTTYSFRDFPDGVNVNVSNVTFIGCRFQSNSVDYVNVNIASDVNDTVFKYCTFCPVTSKAPAPTHNTWPSAGAGTIATGNSGYAPYMIGGTSGYQFAIIARGGSLTAENCDIWGFGNAISLYGSGQKRIVRCWIHDAANPDAKLYHTDGPGYLDGGVAPSNILIDNCTIASLGNTNGIAFQAASSGYKNVVVQNCYLSGFGYCVDMCHNVLGNRGLKFINNTFGTDIRWPWGPLYMDFATQFGASQSVNEWRGNKLRVVPGTSKAAAAGFDFTAADDGKFIHPNSTLSTVDWS